MLSRPNHRRARDLAGGLIFCMPLLFASTSANAEAPLAADLSHGRSHQDLSELGELPGEMTPSRESRIIMRGANGLGQETLIHRTVRAPGTRAPKRAR